MIDYALVTGVVIPGTNIENFQSVFKDVIHPTNFVPARYENEWPTPNALKGDRIGNSWSISFHPSNEARTSDKVESHLRVQQGMRFHSPLVEKTHLDGDVWTPIIDTYEKSQWHSLPPQTEGSVLAKEFDSLTHPDKAILLFSEGSKSNFTLREKGAKFADQALTLSALYVQVPTSEWTSFNDTLPLQDLKLKTAAWANNLITQKKATTLYAPSMMLRFRKGGSVGDVNEQTYPTEYFRSDFPETISRENSLIPAAFNTQNIGYSLSLEPTQDLSGVLILKYSSYLITYHGKTPYHRFFNGKEWIADAWVPQFSNRGQSGTVALNPGENTLVGVSASIDDQGNPDPENRLLFFLKAE